ncbi:hypothetical protein F4677DRAFT_442905 [Hypoxylon crocopeplum]|nr:hypothetical protein F4677DRAFT_442905 [Hypoxylon crocopeplum]
MAAPELPLFEIQTAADFDAAMKTFKELDEYVSGIGGPGQEILDAAMEEFLDKAQGWIPYALIELSCAEIRYCEEDETLGPFQDASDLLRATQREVERILEKNDDLKDEQAEEGADITRRHSV